METQQNNIDEMLIREAKTYLDGYHIYLSKYSAEVVHRLPTFLTSYAAELKRRHKRYAALRDITDRMSNDIQEMN